MRTGTERFKSGFRLSTVQSSVLFPHRSRGPAFLEPHLETPAGGSGTNAHQLGLVARRGVMERILNNARDYFVASWCAARCHYFALRTQRVLMDHIC
jgi:hypothetical protein